MGSDQLIRVSQTPPVRSAGAHRPGGMPPADLGPEHNLVRELMQVLQKRRLIILSVVLTIVALTAVISLRMKKTYEAAGRIVINREVHESYSINDSAATVEDWDYSLELDTQVKIIQSDAVIQKSLARLAGRSAPGAPAGAAPGTETRAVEAFRSGLKISVLPKTRMIEVRYSSANPNTAANAVNAVIDTYIEENVEARYESVMQASDFLAKQLSDLKVRVETSQEKLVEYQKQSGIVGIDDKQNIVIARLDELNRELTAAEADRIQKEARYRLAKTGQASLLQSDDLLTRLRSQQSELRNRDAQLRTQFGAAYPKVAETENQLRDLDGQIRATEEKIFAKIRTEYEAAAQRESLLRGSLEQQKAQANQLNEKSVQYMILKRDADSNRQLYEGLLQKLKEAGVSAGLKSSNVRVVDRALVPLRPAKPNILRNLLLSLLLGLAGGIACALIVESLDNTIRTPEQIEGAVMLPTLGTIPRSTMVGGEMRKSLMGRKPAAPKASMLALVTHSRPRSNVAEAYRALRTSILLSSAGAPPKVIVFTSALPQEGKTSTCLNFACVLAQQGSRVLLVDCDLRRPALHRAISLPDQRGGMTTLLSGHSRVDDVLLAVPGVVGLNYIAAGPTSPRPADLLGSPEMQRLLGKWRGEYDHIILDTPPVLSVTDAVVVSVMADSVLLVVRAGQTRKEAVRRARELLVHVAAPVTGVVLNDVDASDPYYSYYYGAKYDGLYYHD